LAGLLACQAAWSQFNWPACPDFQESEFRYVKVVTRTLDPTLDEPVKMAFDRLPDGRVDVYFVERHGKIKRYSVSANAVSVIGQLDVYSDTPTRVGITGQTEGGLGGIALDPEFRNNGWIYLYYEPWAESVFRVSRFTVAQGVLQPGSERILLSIPAGRKVGGQALVLPGAPLAFDLHGDLWIGVGANARLNPSVDEGNRAGSAEASSSDPSDLRGSILRIHPDASAAGYRIPSGNFGEYWSTHFRARGDSDLAAEYSDTAKVRPEVYAKGTRNPYTLNVDPVRQRVTWADYGPNQLGPVRVEEQNLIKHPVFAGYPYWCGKNAFLLDTVSYASPPVADTLAPGNRSR
jgi:cytochrome c